MNYNVPTDYQINVIKKSTTKTINNYQKKEVIEALYDSMKKGLIIDANYWAAELFSSGFYLPLWDSIFRFYFQYVNYVNPNFIDYLNQKYLLLCQAKKLYSGNLKNLCNNQELRNHLAEIITLFCLSEKTELIIPSSLNEISINDEMSQKTNQIIQIIAPYLSQQSLIHQQFHSFIVNYYGNDLDNCIHYINWFVKDNEYTINSFSEFKVPTTISQKSMWLIWKFLLLQYKTIKNAHMNLEQITELLDLLMHLYIMIYKRKDNDSCSYILSFILLMTKHPDQIDWSQSLDITDSRLIKQCAEINLIYRNLQNAHTKITETTNKEKTKSKGRKTKKEIEKNKFYEDPKNQEFLKLLYDTDAIMTDQPIKQINTDDKNIDDSDDEEEIIPIILSARSKSQCKLKI